MPSKLVVRTSSPPSPELQKVIARVEALIRAPSQPYEVINQGAQATVRRRDRVSSVEFPESAAD